MTDQFSRTKMLIGEKALNKIKNSSVIVFGIGGVGSFVVEALARVGVGKIDLVDNDIINETNINRQLIATHKTIGMSKVDVAKERVLEINPSSVVNTYKLFYSAETSHEFDLLKYDYVIDAIDSVSGKIELILNSKNLSVPIISSMGTGNKLDPTQFTITDIYKTSVCPLARVMRTELKKRGVKNLKVLYSKEIPIKSNLDLNNKLIPASISFVPSVAGLIIAGEVVKDLIAYNEKEVFA